MKMSEMKLKIQELEKELETYKAASLASFGADAKLKEEVEKLRKENIELKEEVKKFKRGGRKPIPDSIRAEIQMRYVSKEFTITELAKMYNLATGTVHKIIHEVF